jgi:hypothetical protein
MSAVCAGCGFYLQKCISRMLRQADLFKNFTTTMSLLRVSNGYA